MHSRILADLHRHSLGHHCASKIQIEEYVCDRCEAQTNVPLLHYLLECPETALIRNVDHDTNEDTAVAVAETSNRHTACAASAESTSSNINSRKGSFDVRVPFCCGLSYDILLLQ